ncbi:MULTISPECIES: energy-coupling factor ABC transporter ATP-binding protein [Mesorhizobium]|uniref:ABC transporter ATP-binding protein n=1 Tax=Mesorhizobium denitrificans TaxID=2294114 RepID=A0A371XIA4_9HYPH|nr:MULTISPECIES: ABC transporter ATP-binding protein [Mesorhizobium]RFC68960.1 ABC transporter ATP-binding protein [Mesorhizobium denitrificans]
MDIRFADCGVRFGERVALQPLNLRLEGRRVGIIGLNGSGKTTFARLMIGLTSPSTGSVSVNGVEIKSPSDGRAAGTGFVFQTPQSQLIMPVVREDILFGLKARGIVSREADACCAATLARLGAENLAGRRVHELSGGEVQLAAMASVLALEPRLVVFDEPTSQLDLKNRRIVVSAIEALDEDAIIVTHDLELAESLPRVLLFHEGRLEADGSARDAIDRYRRLAA